MAVKGSVRIEYNKATAFAQFTQQLANAQERLFDSDIREDAVENSPYDTGTNARSIETETKIVPGVGVVSTIFTTSGYGGYLELGHRVLLGSRTNHGRSAVNLFAMVRGGQGDYVQGRPYLYPAVMRNLPKLYAIAGLPVPTGVAYQDLFGGAIGDTYTGGIAHYRSVKKGVLKALKKQKGSYKSRIRNNRTLKIG